MQDIRVVETHTLDECIENCAMVNSTCEAVTYEANITNALTLSTGNCWVKNFGGVGSSDSELASAYLIMA